MDQIIDKWMTHPDVEIISIWFDYLWLFTVVVVVVVIRSIWFFGHHYYRWYHYIPVVNWPRLNLFSSSSSSSNKLNESREGKKIVVKFVGFWFSELLYFRIVIIFCQEESKKKKISSISNLFRLIKIN